jgi:hypothetical protein
MERRRCDVWVLAAGCSLSCQPLFHKEVFAFPAPRRFFFAVVLFQGGQLQNFVVFSPGKALRLRIQF